MISYLILVLTMSYVLTCICSDVRFPRVLSIDRRTAIDSPVEHQGSSGIGEDNT